MTTPQNRQLDHLRLEWRSLARSPSSREAATILVSLQPRLGLLSITDLGDVVRLLEPGGGLDQIERARLVGDLLAAIPSHPLIQRALLQTLLPGVVSVARRLQWGRGTGDDPSSFLADLITTTYEILHEWGGEARPYAAPDLLNALRCRMRRRIDMTTDGARLVSMERVDGTQIEPPPTLDDDPFDSVVMQLVEGSSDEDRIGAAALYGREVLGYSYRELAVMTGISPRRLAAAGREVARRIQS